MIERENNLLKSSDVAIFGAFLGVFYSVIAR